ncbi:carbohydrate ABC transporter permease [Pilimelia columellifera]
MANTNSGRRITPPASGADDTRSLAVLGVVAVFLPPLALLVAASLRPPGSPPPATPQWLPDPASLAAYPQAVAVAGLAQAALNSAIVCLIATPLSLLVASWAGFALSQAPRRARRAVVAASLLALTAPASALLVPRFALYRGLHLTDTLVPLIAPALIATSPLYPLVYLLAFRAIPADLYEECRLAGLSPWRTWWRLGVPLTVPVSAGLGAFVFVTTWSNVVDPLIYLYDRERFTVPLALRSLTTLDTTDTPVLLAGAVLATAPALLVFGVAQWLMRRRHS